MKLSLPLNSCACCCTGLFASEESETSAILEFRNQARNSVHATSQFCLYQYVKHRSVQFYMWVHAMYSGQNAFTEISLQYYLPISWGLGGKACENWGGIECANRSISRIDLDSKNLQGDPHANLDKVVPLKLQNSCYPFAMADIAILPPREWYVQFMT